MNEMAVILFLRGFIAKRMATCIGTFLLRIVLRFAPSPYVGLGAGQCIDAVSFTACL